ncbi:MAG TPA: MerR family transcriptional regulator [Bacteroidia bacterium]|jgi:DNA-binding transcriptional MerR regulator|nr:MerR family transcriptional regulator [Bacteroidia bacterium]
MDEETPEKLFYSISEVAELFKVNASLIRFWEKEFDFLKPRKTAKGNRTYTKKDIENIRLVYHLVKEKGFTLQGAKEKLKQKPAQEINKNLEAIDSLNKLKSFLLELKSQL